MMNYERGGLATIANILPISLKNQPDGTLDLKEIEKALQNRVDEHVCPVRGINLESSVNNCSGRVLRPQYIKAVKKLAKKYKVTLNLDGARIWNAAVKLDIEMKELV